MDNQYKHRSDIHHETENRVKYVHIPLAPICTFIYLSSVIYDIMDRGKEFEVNANKTYYYN